MFGIKSNKEEFKWEEITSVEEVDEIHLASNEKIQVIYKHSRTCGVCYISRNSLEKMEDEIRQSIDLYMVDVIRDRPISQYIAEKYGIRHESPQMLIIKDGEVIWHGSHYKVKLDNLVENLNAKS